jgi:hypothetical protein
MATKRRSALLSLFTVSPFSPFDYDRLAAARKAKACGLTGLGNFSKKRATVLAENFPARPLRYSIPRRSNDQCAKRTKKSRGGKSVHTRSPAG